MASGWHTPSGSGGSSSGGATDPELLAALDLIAQKLQALTNATVGSSELDGQYVVVIDPPDAAAPTPENAVLSASGNELVDSAGNYLTHSV